MYFKGREVTFSYFKLASIKSNHTLVVKENLSLQTACLSAKIGRPIGDQWQILDQWQNK
jgi:hypothetical protein